MPRNGRRQGSWREIDDGTLRCAGLPREGMGWQEAHCSAPGCPGVGVDAGGAVVW